MDRTALALLVKDTPKHEMDNNSTYLLQREYDRIWALTKPASPDAVRKISGFLNKVKDRADDRIQSMANTGSPETQRKLTGMLAKVKEGAEKAKVRTRVKSQKSLVI